MKYNPKFHHRKSIRLKHYDYSNPNWYFVTICTKDKECLFGEIKNGRMILNNIGSIVKEELFKTKEIRRNVDIDYYVIMPNHIHAIIIIEYKIESNKRRGELQFAPTNKFVSPSHTIGAIVRGFKGSATKRINVIRNKPSHPVWQRNYYEHIIRNEKDLFNIRNYIEMNPVKWEYDEYY